MRRAAGAALVACFDRDPALSRELADDLSAWAAPDLTELLADPKVDAVVVATPHDTHEEIARAVVGAGRHLLLQKPLSVDLPSARRIAAFTNSAPVTAGLLFPGRYTAAYRAARAARDHNLIGPVTGLVATYLVDKPPSYYLSGYSGRSTSDWRLSKARSGGGVIIMNLLHHLDLAQSLLDAEAEWVFAHTIPSGHSAEIEDVATLVVGYGPTVASFVGAASVPGGPGEHLRLWGRHGQCQILPSWHLTTASASTIDLRPEPEDPQAIAIDRFVQAVRAGHPPDVTIDHALRTAGRRDGCVRVGRYRTCGIAGGRGAAVRAGVGLMWWWPTDAVPAGAAAVVDGEAWGRIYPDDGNLLRRAAADFLSTARAVGAVVGDPGPIEVLGTGMLATLVRERMGPAVAGAATTMVDTTGEAERIRSAVAELPRFGRLVLAAPPRTAQIPLATYRDVHVRALTLVGVVWATAPQSSVDGQVDELLRRMPLATDPGEGWYLRRGEHG